MEIFSTVPKYILYLNIKKTMSGKYFGMVIHAYIGDFKFLRLANYFYKMGIFKIFVLLKKTSWDTVDDPALPDTIKNIIIVQDTDFPHLVKIFATAHIYIELTNDISLPLIMANRMDILTIKYTGKINDGEKCFIDYHTNKIDQLVNYVFQIVSGKNIVSNTEIKMNIIV